MKPSVAFASTIAPHAVHIYAYGDAPSKSLSATREECASGTPPAPIASYPVAAAYPDNMTYDEVAMAADNASTMPPATPPALVPRTDARMCPHQAFVQLSSGEGLAEALATSAHGHLPRSAVWSGYRGVFYCAATVAKGAASSASSALARAAAHPRDGASVPPPAPVPLFGP